jgi:RNA polymerase sigma factor (sigma-70 family)
VSHVEEAAAEAFATAVERWPADGVPPNPGAWLTTTANRKAIDRIRRENKRDDRQKEAQLLYQDDPLEPLDAIDDERLRLIFTCCHPALAMQTRVALTLRMVGGLTVAEIARAFLVQETAMGQRITRAKAKIKAARIPYQVPSAADLPARVSGVLAVLFLVFNEGYLATGRGTDPVRHDLTAEAIRLTRLRSSFGQIRKLRVLTCLGPEKAIAIATHADDHGYGSPDGTYDIDVRNWAQLKAMNAALPSARASYLTGWNSEAVDADPFPRGQMRM